MPQPDRLPIGPDGRLGPEVFEIGAPPPERFLSGMGIAWWIAVGGLLALIACTVAVITLPSAQPVLMPVLVTVVVALGLFVLTMRIGSLLNLVLPSRARRAPSRVRPTMPEPAWEPTSDDLVAQFATWAFTRFGVRLTPAQVRRLLGEDDDSNVIVLDGVEVMLGTPMALRPAPAEDRTALRLREARGPAPTFSLIALPSGDELRVMPGR